MSQRIKCVAVFLISFTAWAFIAPSAFSAQTVVIGTGSSTGVYIMLGERICNLIRLQTSKIHCDAKTSKGSVDNIVGLKQGLFDIAIVQSDVHYHAVNGQAMFKKTGANPNLRSLFSAHQESLVVLVKEQSNVTGLANFPGKHINIGPNGSGANTTMRMILAMNGWKTSTFSKVETLSNSAQANKFCRNELDIFTYVAGHPNALVKRMLRDCPARMLSIEGPVIDKLIKRFPYYVKTTIPRTAYIGLDRDVTSIGMLATVLTTTRLDDRIAQIVTQAVFESLRRLRRSASVFRYLHPIEMATRGMTAPLHKGAHHYLKTSGRVK